VDTTEIQKIIKTSKRGLYNTISDIIQFSNAVPGISNVEPKFIIRNDKIGLLG
jgi:hypothetical protein